MPERLGRYLLGDALGAGAMGQVYRARDELLARDVAVKVERSIPGLRGLALKTFQERFLREGRALAALSHPNVVRIFDMGIEDGTPYVVMEIVAGRSLRARLDEAPLDAGAARTLGVQMARALDAAHSVGLLHRDVKPANVLEAEPGVWKLADFGVARLPDSELTLVGQFVGTPAYAAPEARARGEFSPRSDVYSLAATLYEALAGVTPFAKRELDASVVETLDPPPLPDTVPAELAQAVLAGLAVDPVKRPIAAELAEALAGAAAPSVPTRPPPDLFARRRLAVSAGVLAATFVAGILVGRCSVRGSTKGGPTASAGPARPGQPAAGTTVRTGKHAERWRKANEKLDKGDVRAAAEELMRILAEHPDDVEARAILDRLSREGQIRIVEPEDD